MSKRRRTGIQGRLFTTDPVEQPLGYQWLIERYELRVPPPFRRAVRTSRSQGEVITTESSREELFPARTWPRREDDVGHLRFALRHQRLDLNILAAYFKTAGPKAINQWLDEQPTGGKARRFWFFYEWATGDRLDRPDADSKLNFVDAVDPRRAYTSRGRPSRRHRVTDNLLGDARYCPMVHRTDVLDHFAEERWDQKIANAISGTAAPVRRRAIEYLYRRETKSSFAIEDESPSIDRIERFVEALRRAGREDLCHKDGILNLQRVIRDPRFVPTDWRRGQIYVGESISWTEEKIHHICPRPDDLDELMDGWERCHQRLAESSETVPAVVRAGVLGYGFVILHPLDDGNGRTHRLLIHNQLAVGGLTPTDTVIPVSAVMARDPAAYDRSLESVSRPLLDQIEYRLDGTGSMIIESETIDHYRYPNFTVAVESLTDFVRRSVDEDLSSQLSFLEQYDATFDAIQSIVDLPDRLLGLMVKITLRNGGRLPKSKRKRHFESLTDDEVAQIESAVGKILTVNNSDAINRRSIQ